MEIKQIRMGIVGAGTWGRTHASIYAEHLFADPVAICDMNEARAREIADEFGIRKVYTDYHDMAADEEIDAVAIVTPDFAHADIACAMADAKKDILIEKPLATTKEDIARICEAVEKNGVRCIVSCVHIALNIVRCHTYTELVVFNLFYTSYFHFEKPPKKF